ncbi:MAG: NnrS family protein, partial [Myxococcales bacterium]|nr:NnrS family protein [Myxococcales bacterium]
VLLLAGSALGWWPVSAGVHALTTGAIATMIVAIASRAALGHTGRPLQSHPVLNLGYAMITLAAVLRVLVVAVPDARAMLLLSAASWSLGFACFAWRYMPILVRPPLDPRLPA